MSGTTHRSTCTSLDRQWQPAVLRPPSFLQQAWCSAGAPNSTAALHSSGEASRRW